MTKITGRSLILGIVFLTLAWTQSTWAQIPACPEGSSKLNPAQILNIYNQKMVAQRSIIQYSTGYLNFLSGAHEDNVIRKTFPDQSVKYEHQKLELKGTAEQIKEDEGSSVQDFLDLEWSGENYQINFDRTEGESVYVYKLFPKSERKGRFKDGAELFIDRTTCMPVEVSGDVFAPVIAPHITSQFQEVNGLILISKSQVTFKKPIYVGGGDYFLTVTFKYSPSDVILKTP